MFSDNNQRLVKCNTLGCDRIDVWSSYANIKPGSQEKYYSIQIIDDGFVLCFIHLCTDLYGDHSDERLAIIHRIMYDVHKSEDKIQSQRTMVIGDINEMPYGRGCLNANGFHGLPELNISDKPTRTVNEIEYRKFYNPMWNLMGDFYDIQDDLGEQSKEDHRYEVFLTVKGLEHYRYRMMFVDYGAISYPATIVLNEMLAI